MSATSKLLVLIGDAEERGARTLLELRLSELPRPRGETGILFKLTVQMTPLAFCPLVSNKRPAVAIPTRFKGRFNRATGI